MVTASSPDAAIANASWPISFSVCCRSLATMRSSSTIRIDIRLPLMVHSPDENRTWNAVPTPRRISTVALSCSAKVEIS